MTCSGTTRKRARLVCCVGSRSPAVRCVSRGAVKTNQRGSVRALTCRARSASRALGLNRYVRGGRVERLEHFVRHALSAWIATCLAGTLNVTNMICVNK